MQIKKNLLYMYFLYAVTREWFQNGEMEGYDTCVIVGGRMEALACSIALKNRIPRILWSDKLFEQKYKYKKGCKWIVLQDGSCIEKSYGYDVIILPRNIYQFKW